MLSKEKLLEMGIAEELADKILEDINKDYVPSYRYKEVKDSVESLNSEISKRDKQIDGLKKLSGNKEELEAEINSLKEANKKALVAEHFLEKMQQKLTDQQLIWQDMQQKIWLHQVFAKNVKLV